MCDVIVTLCIQIHSLTHSCLAFKRTLKQHLVSYRNYWRSVQFGSCAVSKPQLYQQAGEQIRCYIIYSYTLSSTPARRRRVGNVATVRSRRRRQSIHSFAHSARLGRTSRVAAGDRASRTDCAGKSIARAATVRRGANERCMDTRSPAGCSAQQPGYESKRPPPARTAASMGGSRNLR